LLFKNKLKYIVKHNIQVRTQWTIGALGMMPAAHVRISFLFSESSSFPIA